METAAPKRKRSKTEARDFLFHLLLLAWPVTQFAVFYIYVNLNSFRLAFNFGELDGFGFFGYFEQLFTGSSLSVIMEATGRSVLFFLITTVIAVPLGLMFGYYIGRKFPGGKAFRFLLFLPSIISAMVMAVIFKKFTDLALTSAVSSATGQVSESITSRNSQWSYVAVLAFHLFINFGTTTLIYANRVSEISPEIFEASELDGVNRFQEFWHITLPSVFPTLSTFLITSVATIFVNQYDLFTFYASDLGAMGSGTIGYYIYNSVQSAAMAGDYNNIVFHQMAALGICCTAIIVPLVFSLRWALGKFGPKED